MFKVIPTILSILLSLPLVSQGIQETFGKNRIQYHDDFDDWWMYETENFVTHWYGKARNVGISAMQIAEKDYFEIQNILEHRINDKIEILVYVDQTDVKQSNLGDDETYYSRTGQTTVSGNKIFVYFDGNHQRLNTQIREGIATVYLDAIMFGSNLQEFVQNTISLKIPEWYKIGMISFIGSEWNVDLDARLRELFNSLPNKKFEKLANFYPEDLGHAFWYYVAKTYGKSSLANIIYLTRINKTHKKAFLFILGIPFTQIAEDCLAYFRTRYQTENQYFSPPNSETLAKSKNKKFQSITTLKWNADASMLAYVVMDQGKAKIYIYDVKENRHFQIWKTGFKNNIQEIDFNYPVLAWHPIHNQLMVFDEKRDVIRQLLFDLDEGSLLEDVASPLLQRIYSAAYLSPELLVLSATEDGYSNLYQYNLRYRTVQPITKDIYDDLQVNVFDQEGKTAILFASNRGNPNEYHHPDSTLPIGNLDLYQLYLIGDSFAISRLTKTPNINEYNPIRLDENSIHYLSEETGVVNRKKKVLLENTSGFLTNYGHNILTYDIRANQVAEVIRKDDKDHLYVYPLSDQRVKPGYSTHFSILYPGQTDIGENAESLPVLPGKEIKRETISEARDTKEYLFQSEFIDPETTVFEKLDIQEPEEILTNEDISTSDQMTEAPVVFQFSKMVASRLKFKFDRFFSNLDNNLLFGGLNTYAGQKQGFEYPPMGILFKASIEDVFEDYGFEGGIRIPTSFDGSEYFIIFDDKKRRIDKRYALYKKSRFVDDEGTSILGNRSHETTFIGLSQWSYPFSVYTSLRAIGTFRLDKRTQLASDLASLESVGQNDQRLGLRFEFIFDNALDIDLNISHGTRLKAYVELVKKMQMQLFEPWKFELNEGFMTILGLDARHYIKLDRYSILANRLAASTSFGSERILYFMGGVDNWLFPSYNEDVAVPPSSDFAYNTLAAHLRGFQQNIRNGTSYALINSELRVPMFKYLFPQKKHSLFLRNFQLTAFADIGTAWHGSNPFSAENPLNIISVSNPLVTVDVSYSRSPIVLGYGAGARLYLLGYFIRADYGWGLENGIVKKPRFYLAFGVDF